MLVKKVKTKKAKLKNVRSLPLSLSPTRLYSPSLSLSLSLSERRAHAIARKSLRLRNRSIEYFCVSTTSARIRANCALSFCSPLFSRILWSLSLTSGRSYLTLPLGLPMGKTCAYWMPPMAVMAPTIIANGGSASNSLTVSVWKKSSRSNARVRK